MEPRLRPVILWTLALAAALAATPSARAIGGNPAQKSMDRFLAQAAVQHAYRAVRRLSADNGSRAGWAEAVTEYAPETGFRYYIADEGGSGYIRNNVLRAVLDGERDVMARGELDRTALTPDNYTFETSVLRPDGLLTILVAPRRNERTLVAGSLLLDPDTGDPVRLEARLARNPSFWVTNVAVVRRYERIAGVVMPISTESTARIRMLGPASFRMTYRYLEIDRQPVGSP